MGNNLEVGSKVSTNFGLGHIEKITRNGYIVTIANDADSPLQAVKVEVPKNEVNLASDDPGTNIIREKAESGNAQAQFELGMMYRKGSENFPQDVEEYSKWMAKAASQGLRKAQYSLGKVYAQGKEVPQDLVKAFHWFLECAKHDNIKAQKKVAQCYEKGAGVAKNCEQAVFWYHKAAKHGHAEAQFSFAVCLDSGYGVKKDEQKAMSWYKKAAKQEHSDAKAALQVKEEKQGLYDRIAELKAELAATKKKIIQANKKNTQIENKLKRADKKLSKAETEISDSEEKLRKAEDTLGKKEKTIKQLEKAVDQNGDNLLFDNPLISGWLLSGVTPDSLGLPEEIGTVGSSPYEETRFDELINRFGFSAVLLKEASNVAVVGRHDLELDLLVENLGLESGNKPKIYSQEMFMLFLMTGKDPFDAPIEVLYEFAKGHPVLEALKEIDFEWPAIHEREPSDEGVIVIDGQLWHSQSPLTAMGYHVGKTGLKAAQRRRILKKIMEHRLQFPRGFSSSEKSEWGQAATSTRLEKIANHIAFNVSFRSTQTRYRYAVKDWKSDLAWLKKTYYHKIKRRFSWPGV